MPTIYSINILKTGLEKDLLQGFIVKIKEEVVGALFYSELNRETIDVNFEIINSKFDGVGQLLNNHLGQKILGKYKFINRESDLGLAGLRKSKLSYRPYRILKKCDL